MEYSIKSSDLLVKARSFGGELTSIQDAAGTEYLWQGNPQYWHGQAPVLFPIVGSLRGKTAVTASGKVCFMERHGVARKKEFRLTKQEETSVAFELDSDDETRGRYPFD